MSGQFRAFYITTIGNAVYVLHAFRKKTQKTSPKDIALDEGLKAYVASQR